MSKNAIRRRVLNRRDALSPADIAFLSAEVTARFLASDAFLAAKTLVLYCAIRSEVTTVTIFAAALRAGKRILYPRTVGETLEFVPVESLEALTPSRFGIHEPLLGAPVPLAEINLIVLPGVAFDQKGIRLGYGMGCYDRVLAEPVRPILVGLAYDFQVVPSLPREEHDIPVNMVVTERTILSI